MDEDSDDELAQDNERAECTLEKSIKKLVQFISDKRLMEESMLKVGYDTKKLPLGKLSAETVKKGFETLNKIDLVIDDAKNNKINSADAQTKL